MKLSRHLLGQHAPCGMLLARSATSFARSLVLLSSTPLFVVHNRHWADSEIFSPCLSLVQS
jgi:hypothetical protein